MRTILLIMIGVSLSFASDIFNDSKTGLTWQDDSTAKNTKMNWTEAKNYCSDLSLSGHSDWRLPNMKALQTIIDISRYNPAIKKGFKNVNASGGYWSSSVYVPNTKVAWFVDFEDGYTFNFNKTNEFYVRCVRGR